MGGRNKALLKLDGRSFLNRIVTALEGCFDQLLLVTRQPQLYRNCSVRVVEDIFAARTPLSGIHAGLVNMDAEFGFCISCDTPFLKTELVRMLIGEIDTGFDIVVPSRGSYLQPLCAVYSKRCIPVIEDRLSRGDVKTDGIYEALRVKKIPYECLQKVDPQLSSFFNVNTPQDLQTVIDMDCRREATENGY
jgi:molybdopterin-guanine dinucleotide biosynthesis protein A